MLGTAATRATDSGPPPAIIFPVYGTCLGTCPDVDVEIASKLSLFSILMAGPVFLSSFSRRPLVTNFPALLPPSPSSSFILWLLRFNSSVETLKSHAGGEKFPLAAWSLEGGGGRIFWLDL